MASLEEVGSAMSAQMKTLESAIRENTAELRGAKGGAGKAAGATAPAATRPPGRPPSAAKPKATLEQVIAVASQLGEVVGADRTKELVKSFGAERSRQLKPEQYDAFVLAAQAEIDAAAGGGDEEAADNAEL